MIYDWSSKAWFQPAPTNTYLNGVVHCKFYDMVKLNITGK